MMTVIAKSIHDLLIDSITVYPSEPAIGDSVSVTVFITDSGPEPTDASVLAVTTDADEESVPYTVPELDSEETFHYSFKQLIESEKEYYITAEAVADSSSVCTFNLVSDGLFLNKETS
jgi:hypothetical protein